MKTIVDIATMWQITRRLKTKSIGFVPTMGYLHEGHLSLVKKSLAENDITVVSIFVNPIQFGQNEDLDNYPRDLQRDEKLLAELAVDYVFYPSAQQMYPSGFQTTVEVSQLARNLCGLSRPDHFKGVATVVLKLFQIILPDNAYFGQKDAQQAIIIKRMVVDLNLAVNVSVLPIIREKDGLALSSRNKYLSNQQRESAKMLPRALDQGRSLIRSGITDTNELRSCILAILGQDEQIKVEYVEFVDLNTLKPIKKVNTINTLCAAAVWIGSTRLIDNFILGGI